MHDCPHSPNLTVAIGAVERDTGLPKDTLRVWERRYGFPAPARDAFGERAYPLDQVDKLRLIKRLLDLGHRPGRIVSLPLEQLQVLASAAPPTRLAAETTEPDGALDDYMALVKSHRVGDLRRLLSQSLLRIGLGRFVAEVVAPMNVRVGDAWAQGRFEVFEEHLYTESMQVVLRNAIHTVPESAVRPRVLLTTLPIEAHGLGLLMAEALFVLEGAHCVSLGIQTPIRDIVRATQIQQVDIVALSFSSTHGPNPVLDGLAEVRRMLPDAVELWAGGNNAVLQRRPPVDVYVLRELAHIGPALDRWRASH